jgi:hypothetical protein
MNEPADAETISSSELLRRVSAVVAERRRTLPRLAAPQALDPHVAPQVACDLYPWRKRAGASEVDLAARSSIMVSDFVELPPERFVTYCHQALLGHDPTPVQREVWTRRVLKGWPRMAVVLALRATAEGRRRGTRLRGVVPRISRDVQFLLRNIVSRVRGR